MPNPIGTLFYDDSINSIFTHPDSDIVVMTYIASSDTWQYRVTSESHFCDALNVVLNLWMLSIRLLG